MQRENQAGTSKGVDEFFKTLAKLVSSSDFCSPNQKTSQDSGRKNQ
jgi:hypothetical protein